MESFITSVTARNVQLTLPYAETLSNLVNYNSELTYSPSPSYPSQNQGAGPLDISSKLPTKLSKNPSTYEKELRQIVIDLYSDKEVSAGKPNQLPKMFPSLGVPVVQGSGKSMDLEHKDSLKKELKFLKKEEPGEFFNQVLGPRTIQGHGVTLMEGPVNPLVQVPQLEGATHWGVQRVSSPQSLEMMRLTEPSQSYSESGSEGYFSQENSVATSEGSAIQSLEDLQDYLVKFQNSKQELPSRNVSFSSDLTTPLFDDSGIHLEFAVPDISEEGSGEHSGNVDGDQPVKQEEQQQFRTKLCDGPSFTVRGEDEESEAGDVPEIWQMSPISESHEIREVVSNKNMIPGNEHEKTSDLKNKEDLTRSQMFSPGVEQCSSIQSPKAKGGFLNEIAMSGNKLGLDFSVKADPVVLEEVSSGQKNEFSLREVSSEAPSPKADKSVLMERHRDRHEKRGNPAVSKAVKFPLPLPGQALPVFGLRSKSCETVLNESDAPGNDDESGANLAVYGDVPRLLIPFRGQEPSVVSLSPQDNARVSAFDSRNATKEEVHHCIKDATGVRNPLEREGCPDLELQCASLEGKLESLQGEFASVLKDRKSLQIRLHTVERRLKEELQNALETKPTAVSLVDELRQNKSELENQLRDLQCVYEEKRDNLDEALERLKTASVTIQNLKQKLLSVEGEISKREETVSLLQAEMDSLRKQLDQAKDENEQFKKKREVLNADIASLVDAKEWLQKQLNVAGEARMKMQLETSELESALAGKSQLIERLRCEGARSNQQLTELQQSSLVEKEQILKHMEQVEEGIAQQNLACKELELDKQRIERTLGEKIESLTSENHKLLKLMNSAVEIEKELDAAKQDVVLKETLLDTIMNEKDEIKEQLRLARASTEEYKRNLNELESKFNKTKQELKKAKEDLGEKDCYIEELQEEKRILEGSLEVANEERAACDNAIHTLKLDLEKVDRRFKLMKRELTVKKSQLEETTRQKDGFVSELRSVREGLESQVNLSRVTKEELAQKEKLIEEFQEVKEALEKEMGILAQQVEDSEDQIARLENEKDDIQKQLESAAREMVQLQDRFHQSLLERARLEGELETTRQSNHEEIESLRSQNASLREEFKVKKINMQVEVTKERDKVINLEQELKFIMNEMNRKESQYNQELQVVEESLEETKRRKEIAEQELKRLREVTERGTVELKRNFEGQLEKLQKDVCGLQQEKLQLEQRYDALIKKTANELDVKSREMSHMENEVTFLKGVLEQTKAEAEKMQLCAVELEREKGRLAGVLASQRTLREHVVKMENEIATRESALLEMTSEVDRLKKENEVQRKTATERVERLETQLNSVRLETRKLQDSFRRERIENVSLRTQVEEGASERVELMKKLSIAEKEMKQLQGKIKSEGNEAQRYRSEIEILKGNLLEQQTECEKLQRKLEAALERDGAKSGRVESLEWELGRRNKEVEYLKEQVRMMEERQQLELENLKTALQVSRSETTSLRSELSEARKAKCGYQTKTFELKDSLLSARQVTESIKQELFVKRQELSAFLSDVLTARNLQVLQEQTAKKREAMADCAETGDDKDAADGVPTCCLRPVSGLQECMSSLRSQISSLQKQMNDHTDSVLTATTSWRSFKENVHQLQASCSLQNNQLLTAEKDN